MTALYLPFLFPPWLFGIFAEELTRMPATSDETTTRPISNVTDATPLFKQVTCLPHQWGPRLRKAPHDSPSGHEQHEWKCQCCPLFKITVLPRGQDPRREYRWADGCQFEDEREPGCVPVVTDRGCHP